MVYFESSIDPSFTRSEVCPIYFSDFFPQPPGVTFRMVLDTSLSFHLKNCFSFSKGRDKTRVIVYRCPGNTAVQVTHIFPRYENILARFIGYRIVFSYISFPNKNYYYQYTRPNRKSSSSKHTLSGPQMTDSGLLMHYQPYS